MHFHCLQILPAHPRQPGLPPIPSKSHKNHQVKMNTDKLSLYIEIWQPWQQRPQQAYQDD